MQPGRGRRTAPTGQLSQGTGSARGRQAECRAGPLPCELCQQQTALNPLSTDTQPSPADPIYFLGWLPAPSSRERLPALHGAAPTPTGEAGSQWEVGVMRGSWPLWHTAIKLWGCQGQEGSCQEGTKKDFSFLISTFFLITCSVTG